MTIRILPSILIVITAILFFLLGIITGCSWTKYKLDRKDYIIKELRGVLSMIESYTAFHELTALDVLDTVKDMACDALNRKECKLK